VDYLCGLLSDEKEPLPKGKQWKTIIILSILICLEQWF
jgi:hypothetical protein